MLALSHPKQVHLAQFHFTRQDASHPQNVQTTRLRCRRNKECLAKALGSGRIILSGVIIAKAKNGFHERTVAKNGG